VQHYITKGTFPSKKGTKKGGGIIRYIRKNRSRARKNRRRSFVKGIVGSLFSHSKKATNEDDEDDGKPVYDADAEGANANDNVATTNDSKI